MKAFLMSFICLLVASATVGLQVNPETPTARDSVSANNTIKETLQVVPDTSVYNKPIQVDLSDKITKMNNLKKQADKVYETSLEIHKAVKIRDTIKTFDKYFNYPIGNLPE